MATFSIWESMEDDELRQSAQSLIEKANALPNWRDDTSRNAPKGRRIDLYWDAMPAGLRQLTSIFASREISEERVIEYCRRAVVNHLPSDREFDLQWYLKAKQQKVLSFILAADLLVRQRMDEASYMIFYGYMWHEVLYHGPHTTRAFFQDAPTLEHLEGNLLYFSIAVMCTRTLRKMVEAMTEKFVFIRDEDDRQLILDAVNKLATDAPTPRWSDLPLYEFAGGNILMKMTTKLVDGRVVHRDQVYKDTRLGWWIKLLKFAAGKRLGPDAKCFRVLHKGRSLFLSSSGKKTLASLGIEDGDEITIGGIQSGGDDGAPNDTRLSLMGPTKIAKKDRPKVSGTRKRRTAAAPLLSEHQKVLIDRQKHSRAMIPVLEELEPLLKDIRTRLNDLFLQKSAPKTKGPSARKKGAKPLASITNLPVGDCVGGSAGKTTYPILVGEVANLYKTSKSARRKSIAIDLHGLSEDEALQRLDGSLPLWIATALKGEYPWVIPVDVICGGGSQILSDAVKAWIRGNRQVANRPKGSI